MDYKEAALNSLATGGMFAGIHLVGGTVKNIGNKLQEKQTAGNKNCSEGLTDGTIADNVTKVEATENITTESGNAKPIESGSSTNKFSNWDDMKDAYKGKVTKFLKENKPKGSPIPKNWFEKGGTLEIETLDDGSQIWKYTSAKGDTVPYINQQVKFPKQYMFPDEDIAEFSIGKFTGDRELDKKAALEFLRSEGYDEIPDGYVLHHDYENGKMQLIEEEIHRIFTHYGGNYYNK